MSTQKLSGYVLKKTKFKDTSLIFELFSKEFGKISFLAKGALREKSSYLGKLEFLNKVSLFFNYYPEKTLFIAQEIDLISDSRFLIKNLKIYERLGEIIRILRYYLQTGESHASLYDKFDIMMRGIKVGKYRKAVLYFLIFFMKEQGIDINFSYNNLENEKYVYFDKENGEFSFEKKRDAMAILQRELVFLKALKDGNAQKMEIDTKSFEKLYTLFLDYLKFHFM